MDGVFVEFPRARELWIPAFAGMTDGGVDSRLRGNELFRLSHVVKIVREFRSEKQENKD